MRLERAADSVAENTPTVIISGRALMYCRHRANDDSHYYAIDTGLIRTIYFLKVCEGKIQV